MHCDAVEQIFLLSLHFCWNCCLSFSDIVDCWTPEPTCGTKSWARSKGGGRKKKRRRVSMINFKGAKSYGLDIFGLIFLKTWMDKLFLVYLQTSAHAAGTGTPTWTRAWTWRSQSRGGHRRPAKQGAETWGGCTASKLSQSVFIYSTMLFAFTLVYNENRTIQAAIFSGFYLYYHKLHWWIFQLQTSSQVAKLENTVETLRTVLTQKILSEAQTVSCYIKLNFL